LVVHGDTRPALGVFEPSALMQLEARGLSFGAVMGARGESAKELAASPTYGSLVAELERDLRELADRPKVGGIYSPNRAFEPKWLRDPRARFELVGVVERLTAACSSPAAVRRGSCIAWRCRPSSARSRGSR
jgi:hypothetical protein